MLKSALNVALLAMLILCLVSATVLFGGILPQFALPYYSLMAILGVLWATQLLCCRPVSIRWSPAHVPVLLFAGYAFARYIVSPIEYDSRIELLHVGLYTLVYFLVACNL